MLLVETRKKLIEIAQKASNSKLVPHTFGNFSIRDENTGYICITPSGMTYDKLNVEDIVIVDVDRNIIEGVRKPSVETPIHCTLLKARNDINSVVHVHSSYATSWSACNKNIPPILSEGASIFGGAIKCSPYRMVGSQELADIIVEYMGDSNVVLMGNHGMVTVGESIDSAYTNAVLAEECAKVATLSKIIGNPVELDDESCKQLVSYTKNKYGQK